MTDRDGGFLLPQKVFNGHLPSFLATTCPAFHLLTKVFARNVVHDYLPLYLRKHLPSQEGNHQPLGFLPDERLEAACRGFLFCHRQTYARRRTVSSWEDWITA